MNPQDTELLRFAVLKVFNANRTQYGLGVPAIRHLVRVFGFASPDDSETEDTIHYLAQHKLIEEIARPLSPENRIWRISSLGIALLDERA